MHIVTNAIVAVTMSAGASGLKARSAVRGARVSEAGAKIVIADRAATSAIAVAQCKTTENGGLASRTVAAPSSTCMKKIAAIATTVEAMNGDSRRRRQAQIASPPT